MDRIQKLLGYVIAVVASLLVLVCRLALSDVLERQAELLPFVLAVTAAAWWGGLLPGLCATVLSVLLGIYFIIPPPNQLQIQALADGLNAGIFVIVGTTISLLCEALHASRRRETESQFRTLADSIPQLVWMARPDGERFWFNKRWYDYTGTTFERVKGFGWQALRDPEELPEICESWNRAVKAGNEWEQTIRLRRKDGEMRWNIVRAVPVKNARGEVECWFGTNTDIQDRIEIEHALKNADSCKDQFLATLAHELRNPLASISNAVQLWPAVRNDPDEVRHIWHIMERQVRQMSRLIDDLLDVSRITRGQITLLPQPVDAAFLINAAVETVQPLMTDLRQRLTVTLPDEPLFINGDVARLTQVFSNILNNSAKYTGQNGEISIHVSRDDDKVVFKFRDNGPGIPAHMLEKIFEMFCQVDDTLGRSCGGLGIGLTLVKRFVDLHGGTVVAHSEGVGKGSEFVVTLPMLHAPYQDRRSDHSEQTSEHSRPVPAHRVLIVDDDLETAEMLAKLLRSRRWDATALGDGFTALEWIRARRPDVVFLDIGMPGISGYEVARKLREDEDLEETFLVALTGYGQPDDLRLAREAGFNLHLTKPVRLSSLDDLLFKLPVGRMSIHSGAV
ncbi:MAG: hybrid sensor histidine kinase/response regulator [Planctomycetaceae bacterium]|nr:hybrid sensor histidine kinase/response regulator [Planctomycetaceae bacterium]